MEEDERPAPVAASGRYLVLVVTAPAEAAEAAADLLRAAPTGGVIEEAGPAGAVRLRAYLREDAVPAGFLDALRRRLAALPAYGLGAVAPDVTVERAAEESWTTVWRKHFHAFAVGRRLWVVPTWETPDLPPGAVPLRLDPGQAFGSGLHPSTRLCLRLLEEMLRPGDGVADVGTGSGILAIAAAKLGAASVVAVDNDPVAVEVARANVRQNQVAGRVRVTAGHFLDPLPAPVDLITANLTADLLLALAPAVRPRLRPGGRLLASGVAEPRLDQVRAVLARHGLEVARVEAAGEWCAVVAGARDVRRRDSHGVEVGGR